MIDIDVFNQLKELVNDTSDLPIDVSGEIQSLINLDEVNIHRFGINNHFVRLAYNSANFTLTSNSLHIIANYGPTAPREIIFSTPVEDIVGIKTSFVVLNPDILIIDINFKLKENSIRTI